VIDSHKFFCAKNLKF